MTGVFEGVRRSDSAGREFCCQRVWIGVMDVSVTAGPAFLDVSLVVRQWFYTNVLEHDHRGTPLDNAEEDVVRFGPLKRDVEPETVAIKRQRGGYVLDDEEWRNAGDFRFSHVNFYRRFSRTFTTSASLAARAA